MDEQDERRRALLKQLEENHETEFKDRFETEKSRKKVKREEVNDAISARWNAQQMGRPVEEPAELKPLPENWRNEHWKKLQSMAEEFAGVEAKNKDESVAALEAYEARLTDQAA